MSSRQSQKTENRKLLESINDTVIYFVIALIILLIFVFLLFAFDGVLFDKIGDTPNYFFVARYISNAFDLWSDVLFTYTLYLKNETIFFILSFVFAVLPLLCSILLCIYWIYRWRTMTTSVAHRISEYLNRFSVLLILFSIFSNFESAVSLIQSKLFYHRAFSFQLKQKESFRLKIWRFVNTTLLEVTYKNIKI